MGRYALRRILQMIPVFFIATFLIFIIIRVLPGDPIQAQFGERRIPDNLREAYIDQYNLDESLPMQYVLYMKDLLTGDFGTSIANQQSINDMFKERLPRSLRLASLVIFFETIIGIPVGVWAARHRDSFIDNGILVVTLAVLAMPVFLLAVLAQLYFGLKWGLFPISGIEDGWMSYLLPAVVVAVSSIAINIRVVRATLIETFREDYIRTARAKGANSRRVLGIHALRNSLIPIVTILGVRFGSMIGGLLVTESIFNIPGLGFTIVSAIPQRDNTIIIGFSIFLVMAYMLINFLVDLLYAWLDPRIRYD